MYKLILEETNNLKSVIKNGERKVYKLINDTESLMKNAYTPVSIKMSTEGEITNTFIQFFSFIIKGLKRFVFKESVSHENIYSFLLFEDETFEMDFYEDNVPSKKKKILRTILYVIFALFTILFILGIFIKTVYSYVHKKIGEYIDVEFINELSKYSPEKRSFLENYLKLGEKIKENVLERESIFKQIIGRYNELKEESLKQLKEKTVQNVEDEKTNNLSQNAKKESKLSLPFFTRIKIVLIAFKDVIVRILKESFFAVLILPLLIICKILKYFPLYKLLLSLTNYAILKKVSNAPIK